MNLTFDNKNSFRKNVDNSTQTCRAVVVVVVVKTSKLEPQRKQFKLARLDGYTRVTQGSHQFQVYTHVRVILESFYFPYEVAIKYGSTPIYES